MKVQVAILGLTVSVDVKHHERRRKERDRQRDRDREAEKERGSPKTFVTVKKMVRKYVNNTCVQTQTRIFYFFIFLKLAGRLFNNRHGDRLRKGLAG